MNYKIELIDKHQIGEGAYTWKFNRPADFNFEAGQYAEFKLDKLTTDQEGNSRCFSLASTPDDDFIIIATNYTATPFKQALRDLDFNQEVSMTGPFGDFRLHSDPNVPAVLLAGGIGITPYLSMVRAAYHQNERRQIYLIHSMVSTETMPFAEVFEQLSDLYKGYFHYIPTITGSFDDSWQGYHQRIDFNLLETTAGDLINSKFYITGSERFVEGMKQLLTSNEIYPDAIRTESFPGYN